MRPELHKTETPRESLQRSDVPILRDIGNQLSMLEQNAPKEWLQYFNSFLSSKSISIEMIAKRLNRNGETEKMEEMYDVLIYATHADRTANDNLETSAHDLVEKIVKLAA